MKYVKLVSIRQQQQKKVEISKQNTRTNIYLCFHTGDGISSSIGHGESSSTRVFIAGT